MMLLRLYAVSTHLLTFPRGVAVPVFAAARLREFRARDPAVQPHPPVRLRQRRLQPRLCLRQQGTQV